jgi:hypothetical protein
MEKKEKCVSRMQSQKQSRENIRKDTIIINN